MLFRSGRQAEQVTQQVQVDTAGIWEELMPKLGQYVQDRVNEYTSVAMAELRSTLGIDGQGMRRVKQNSPDGEFAKVMDSETRSADGWEIMRSYATETNQKLIELRNTCARLEQQIRQQTESARIVPERRQMSQDGSYAQAVHNSQKQIQSDIQVGGSV